MSSFVSRLPSSLKQVSRKPVIKRSLIGIVVFFILLGLFGFFALPGILKSQAEQQLTEKLHRQTTIEKIEINPYTMRLTVHGMQMKEPDSDTVFASFDSMLVDLSFKSLFRFAPVVEQFSLTTPYVHLVRKNESQTNIDDLLELANSQPPSDKPARFSVFNIEISGGRIELDDQVAGTKHKIDALKLGIPFISSLPSQIDVFVEPLLSAHINDTPLLIQGKTLPFADPKQAVMDIDIDALDLTDYLRYIPGTPRFKVPSAKLDLKLVANFQQKTGAAPTVLLNGDIHLKSLQVNDTSDKQLVKLPELTVTLKDAKPLDNKLDIARIALNGLEADIARHADGSLNLDNLLLPPKAAAPVAVKKEAEVKTVDNKSADTKPAASASASAPSSAKASANAIQIAIGEVALRNTRIGFDDAQATRP
ncbi:MAG: DUF748 domain-containing protein, partial [Oxalicibacterium faecigallinarum]|uniref:DUF748 domain-containing protein n=1 Tax=Oxalicibacterium faecigallinarum TaxID=573741 RepID=UPI0028092DF1